MKRPTVNDVAALANVSVSTVSRVINGSDKVAPDLAERVNAAVAQLGFTPNVSARNMRAKKNDGISIIIPTIHFSEILCGAVDEAFEVNYKLTAYASNGCADREVECLERVAASGTGGLIFCPATIQGARHLSAVTSMGIPVIIAARRGILTGVPHVYTDHVAACYRATKYLLQHNHRRIAFFAGFWSERPTNVENMLQMRNTEFCSLYSALDRLAGYEKALMEFGMELDKNLIFITGFEYEDGYATCKQALASLCAFDAIMCPTDRVAAGALQALQEQNVQVPKQVSIIGYDDGVFAQSTRPTLTAIHQMSYQIGQRCVHGIADMMQGTPIEDIVLDAELMVRDSTAAKM